MGMENGDGEKNQMSGGLISEQEHMVVLSFGERARVWVVNKRCLHLRYFAW